MKKAGLGPQRAVDFTVQGNFNFLNFHGINVVPPQEDVWNSYQYFILSWRYDVFRRKPYPLVFSDAIHPDVHTLRWLPIPHR